MADLCRTIGSRQASFGIFVNDGPLKTRDDFPWTLRESFGECRLAREYGARGEFIETIPDDATEEQMFDALAKQENWMSWAEQQAWIRKTYPDEFDDAGGP